MAQDVTTITEDSDAAIVVAIDHTYVPPTISIGSGPNQVVQLDSNAKLPVVDGSQLTNMLVRPMGCGRLVVNSATQLSFQVYNGCWILINGKLYAIPGVVAITNASLVANTLYYVYVWMNASTMSLELSTTNHALSVTVGNVGTEIKSGDDTRSLVGMICTNASSQFSSALMANWFNRRTINLQSPVSSYGSPGTYPTEIGGGASIASPGIRVYFLLWADESFISFRMNGNVSVTTPTNVGMVLGIDGDYLHEAFQPMGVGSYPYYNNGNINLVMAFASLGGLTEGLHFITGYGGSNAGVVMYDVQTMVTVRG